MSAWQSKGFGQIAGTPETVLFGQRMFVLGIISFFGIALLILRLNDPKALGIWDFLLYLSMFFIVYGGHDFVIGTVRIQKFTKAINEIDLICAKYLHESFLHVMHKQKYKDESCFELILEGIAKNILNEEMICPINNKADVHRKAFMVIKNYSSIFNYKVKSSKEIFETERQKVTPIVSEKS